MKTARENVVLCTEYDKDVYLLYTKGFTQLYKDGKFATILGELHNNLYLDQSLKNLQLLDPLEYIQTIIHSRVKTLILTEIPPSGDPGIPSYNLENIRRSTDAINNDPNLETLVLFSDIRQQVFQLPNKTNFYLDIMAGNEAVINLTYGEFDQVIGQVRGFFRWVKEQKAVEDKVHFQNYVNNFLVKIKFLEEKLKDQIGIHIKGGDVPKSKWNENVNVLPFLEMFVEIQHSVLDIYMLYDMYRYSLYYDNFVFMVGENHRLNLNEYFTLAGWDELNNKSDDIKNAVNLLNTKQPQTLQGCIEQLDLEPSELEQLKLAYAEQVEQEEYLEQTQAPSKKQKQES